MDLNQRLNHHPNIVRFLGVCAEYIQQAAAAAGLLGPAAAAAQATNGPPHGAATTAGATAAGGGGAMLPGSAPMLAIVMECCHLGTLFSMIGQARKVAQLVGDGSRVPSTLRYGYDLWSRWERRLEVGRGRGAVGCMIRRH